MATQQQYDNEPFIVDEHILSEICWSEFSNKHRDFDYNKLVEVIKFLKSGMARHVRRDYAEAVTYALEELRVPKNQWTVIRAKTSAYFAASKNANALDSKWWEVTVFEKTREIFLYHLSSMSRSESLYNKRGFDLGSVTVEGQICQQKRLVDLHREKCFEITYRILSGKL